MAGHFALEEEEILHPTSYKTIMRYQQKDNSLIKIAKDLKGYSIKHSHGTDKKYSLICRKHKILIPKQLETRVVEWCHHTLCHPNEGGAELTVAQHYYWKNLRKTVHEVYSKCNSCQFLKQNKKS